MDALERVDRCKKFRGSLVERHGRNYPEKKPVLDTMKSTESRAKSKKKQKAAPGTGQRRFFFVQDHLPKQTLPPNPPRHGRTVRANFANSRLPGSANVRNPHHQPK